MELEKWRYAIPLSFQVDREMWEERRVRCVSWNVAGLPVSEGHASDLAAVLPPSLLAGLDLVAVGSGQLLRLLPSKASPLSRLQEVSASASSLLARFRSECPWPKLLRDWLRPRGFVQLTCLYVPTSPPSSDVGPRLGGT